MRLLLFLDTDHLSGPARLALDFASAAQAAGHETLVLGLTRGAQSPGETAFTGPIQKAGLKLSLLRERRRFDPAIFAQFREVIAEFRPDLYQSHGYKGSMLGRRAQRLGVPWQAVFHGFTWENRLVRLYHWLDVRWMRRADEVIVVSRAFGEALRARGVPGERIRWIANAIDEAKLRATASEAKLRAEWREDLPGEAVLAGVIGRFSPEKAPDHFIRALAAAARRDARLHAVMIGEGPMLEECRALAARLGLGPRLRFAGFRTDLATIYEALDMLVIPSRSEGMPTVLLEAMLLGVPAISTRVGAVPDVTRDGETALLVPIGGETALAQAMERLAGDEGLRRRIAASAGAMARERFTVERRTRTILEHAQCLIEKRPLPPGE